jgi:hypothetical protein
MRFAPIVQTATVLLSIWAAPAGAQVTAAFGPKRYTRTAGPPQTFTETFPHCGSSQHCRVVIVNGNDDGAGRVASASISLNGVEVAGAADFSRQPATVDRPAALAEQNRLTLRLDSQPGTFLTIRVDCMAPAVRLSAGNPGESVVGGRLVTALPIVNIGTAAAENVTATEISLGGGTLASPSVPLALGVIAAGKSAALNATFSGSWQPLSSETLGVKGTYSVDGATYCFALTSNFTVPAVAGSANVEVATATPQTVSGGRYPHQPRTFSDDVNMPRWTVPTVGAVSFRTNPSGLRISVDGGTATTTPFSISLTAGAHTIATTSQPGSAGTRYVFKHWSDNGPVTHQINVGADSATYTATFATQYLLNTSVVPSGGGSISVTPSSQPGGFYDAGSSVTITAEPNRGNVFGGFEGVLKGTANPQTITLTGPASVVATFVRR